MKITYNDDQCIVFRNKGFVKVCFKKCYWHIESDSDFLILISYYDWKVNYSSDSLRVKLSISVVTEAIKVVTEGF